MMTARRIAVAFLTGVFLVSISSHLTWAAERSGQLDPAFGARGKVITSFGGSSHVQALGIQSDGKIVAAGHSSNDFALARYNFRGRLDRQFGADGKVLTDFGSRFDAAKALAIQSDGKIVVAGLSYASGTSNDFALARYKPDGTLDATFNGTGKVLTDFGGPGGDAANALAIQSDGKIVAAGTSAANGTYDFALARYNLDGTLDATFNGTGKVLTDFSGSGSADGANWMGMAIQSDGKIVVAGSSNASGTSDDFALARYNPDGTLDATFNGTGKVLTDFSGSGSSDYAFALAIQSDGKIVAAGYSFGNGISYDFALARYNPDGTLDATFNGTGKVLTDFSGSGSGEVAYALAIQSDGKIVVAGSSFASGISYDFALARYNPDGTLDATFNGTGKVLTDFSGSGSGDVAYALAIQSDGKIVTGGVSTDDFALARYLP